MYHFYQRTIKNCSFIKHRKMNLSIRSKLTLLLSKQNVSHYCKVLSQFSNNNSRNASENNDYVSYRKKTSFFVSVALIGSLGYWYFGNERKRYIYAKENIPQTDKTAAGKFQVELPSYSMEEVTKHTTKENRIWVTYKEGVYDITNFIEQHPGGEQILIAAGASVEPFWMLYGIHKNEHVFEILERLRIGNLKKEDQEKIIDIEDPYSTDPIRHVALKPASIKPFNAEVPPAILCESFITPNELFYVRNHLPVPKVDPEMYELVIEGTHKSISFTLEELKKFPKTTITATIMCAGNRRSDMMKVKPVKGLSWGPCAIGNATWTGVRLRDLLKHIGITEDEEKLKHVQFEGLDYDVTANQYGASIPIWKAVDKRGDVILAYEMNGEPLPLDHGYPVRVIVPGVVGARNVKWLSKIIISENESASHWQQNDYKGFSPSIDWDTADFRKSPAIQELPVISAICKPTHGETVIVENGCVSIKGYAWSGGGQKIIRVDVTIDGGKTWHVANLDVQDSALPPQHWAWTLWSAKIPVDANCKDIEIWCKAVDSCYNTQPETFENIWNFRGVLSNAYHRVKVKLNL